jgi:hypothetical protein
MKNDIVIISKIYDPKKIKNNFVFIRNPYNNSSRFSYVVGGEGDWIQHRNLNTLIRVPNGHVWNEPGVLINETEKIRNSGINPSINFIVNKK